MMSNENYVNAVTPQMFGAKADGKTDDSDAFQQAVDSGFDVYVPTAMGETYLIKKTIKITNSKCKRMYSEPICRMSSAGSIIVDFRDCENPRETSLFDVHIQLFHICGIRFYCSADDHRVGVFMSAMDKEVCDYDIQIVHCSIKNFYRGFDFTGRGFEIISSHVGSCNYLANLYWDDADDTNDNHPAYYDQRGINVKNCRLHNIASAFFTVKSGHVYGFHFQGNTVDNGKGFLVRAYEQAYGWNISGNVIQGIKGDFDFMDFRKGMLNCAITGNTFISDIGYWTGTDSTVNSWLKCSGNTTSCIINNNVFKNSDGGFMAFKNIEGSTIVGNVMHNTTDSTAPAIKITGSCQKNSIASNSVLSKESVSMFSKTLPKSNAVSGNFPAN